MEKDYNALDELAPAMPAAWYIDADQYQRELDAVWKKNWLFVCPGQSLAEIGAYKTFSIGDQHAWVVRREGGELAAYYNNCRHRGSVLLTESEGCLSGGSVYCPYHRWRYDLDDGSLISTSSFKDPQGFDKTEHGLFHIAVQEWNGLVFLNFDAAADWQPASIFSSNRQELEKFSIEKLVLGHHWEHVVACNWKTFWDNFNECLHCPGVHRELVKMVPIFKRGLMEPQDHPDWREHIDDLDPAFRGGVREGVETFSMDGSAQGYALAEGLTDEDRKRGVTYVDSVPAVYIGAHADHVRTVRILPLGPESMALSVDWLFHAQALEDPNYDISNVTEFAKRVLEEDGVASELNQRGMHAAPMLRGVLMPEEYDLKKFKEWVEQALAKHESR